MLKSIILKSLPLVFILPSTMTYAADTEEDSILKSYFYLDKNIAKYESETSLDGFVVGFGFGFTDYLALEFDYNNFGQVVSETSETILVRANVTNDDGQEQEVLTPTEAITRQESENYGVGVGVKLNIPINNKNFIFMKYGKYKTSINVLEGKTTGVGEDSSSTYTRLTGDAVDESMEEILPYYSIGWTYKIKKSLDFNVKYIHYPSDNLNTIKLLSFGINFY